ncbi:MAG: tetratricopeptide repeat protein [Cellvibrionaceae bacterium]|nr:tetratricopeptide repeat protein [Cellvibrionaceae bacterium]
MAIRFYKIAACFLLSASVIGCANQQSDKTIPDKEHNSFQLFNEAAKLYTNGKYAQAEVVYIKAAKLAPKNPEIFLQLGNSQFRQGKTLSASINYQRSLLYAPNEPRALFNKTITELINSKKRLYRLKTILKPNHPNRPKVASLTRNIENLLSAPLAEYGPSASTEQYDRLKTASIPTLQYEPVYRRPSPGLSAPQSLPPRAMINNHEQN